MTIGLELDNIIDEIGSSDFFLAFFFTVSRNLEPEGWGTRYPVIVEKLYNGFVSAADADAALAELDGIRAELAKFPVSDLVWDIDDPSKRPPWGDKISKDITDLSNYFVTSTGRDLLDTLVTKMEDLKSFGGTVKVINF